MKPTAWRYLLLCACVVFMAQEALTVYWLRTTIATPGVSVSGSAAPFHWVLSVEPGSDAYGVGLRDGDVVDASALSPLQRFRLITSAFNINEPLLLPVIRNGHVVATPVPQRHTTIDPGLWMAIFAGFWAGACAVVLLVRKPTKQVFFLVAWLLLMRLNIQMNPSNWVTPWPAGDVANALLDLLTGVGWVLLAHYAAGFLDRPSRAARALLVFSYGIAILAIVVDGGALLASWFAFADPGPTQSLVAVLWMVLFFAPVASGVVVFTRIRSNREQLGWTLLSAGLYGAIYTYFNVSGLFEWLNVPALFIPALVLQLVAPVVLTYAMLNRRLLDIGFALNRAAVFTGVSIVVVGIFVLVEWAFGEWFASATHVENAFVSGGLALALGLSVRAIHHRVDLVLDSLFFRKRHENERSLRAFAHEAPYITNTQTLLARTKLVLEEHADASFVNILLHDGQSYSGIDDNDEAFVALRAWHRMLDLRTVRTVLPGEFAYPLVARGRLLGALALGPKRSGESYAPDESSAIDQVAHAVGTSLDVLRRVGGDDGALLDAIRGLQTTVGEIVRRMDASAEKA